jgi:hypothetical protein
MKASLIKTGMILYCTHHNIMMEIIDDNEGHPAGDDRPVRAKSLEGESFVQAIPAMNFREPKAEDWSRMAFPGLKVKSV